MCWNKPWVTSLTWLHNGGALKCNFIFGFTESHLPNLAIFRLKSNIIQFLNIHAINNDKWLRWYKSDSPSNLSAWFWYYFTVTFLENCNRIIYELWLRYCILYYTIMKLFMIHFYWFCTANGFSDSILFCTI